MSGEKTGDNFAELLKSLEQVTSETDTLAKAAPAPAQDDKKVAAAAADGADEDGDEDDEDGEDGKQEPMLGKSVSATDANGESVEAIDATDLIKSLLARQGSTEDVLSKALESLTGTMKAQNALIKSLQDDVKTLSGQGRGRKTLVTIAEKPGVSDVIAKSDAGAISPTDLLAKSEAAWNAGKLSGLEHNTVDVCLRTGTPIDAGILRKIAAA